MSTEIQVLNFLTSWKNGILNISKSYIDKNEYKEELVAAGLRTSGINPDSGLVEVVEIEDHPFFIGVQYHPEYKSTVLNPHPLFVSFVKASDEYRQKK